MKLSLTIAFKAALLPLNHIGCFLINVNQAAMTLDLYSACSANSWHTVFFGGLVEPALCLNTYCEYLSHICSLTAVGCM